MSKIKNAICYFVAVICLFAMLWIMASWIDVVMHNTPYETEHHYQKWNCFCLMVDNYYGR